MLQFGQEKLQCLYIDTHAFVQNFMSTYTIKGLKTLIDLFDSNLNKDYKVFSNKNEKDKNKRDYRWIFFFKKESMATWM